MAAGEGQQETGTVRHILRWVVRQKYYIESAGGRYCIAKFFNDKQVQYHAFTKTRAGLDNPGKWREFDTGSLGGYGTIEEAKQACQDYEFRFQAGQVKGLYFGGDQ